jgi:ArsR family transcriptional regulator
LYRLTGPYGKDYLIINPGGVNPLKTTSKLFKALSDETRLRILKMLEARPLCVCEIQHVLKGSQPNVSHHLKTLSEAGLVESKKDGLWIDYRLPDKPSTPLHAAALSLVKKSLDREQVVKKDRNVVKIVDRIEITLRK